MSEDKDDITTTPGTVYSVEMLRRIIGKWWWAFAIVIVGGVAALWFDWRWTLVALMLLFIVYPGLLMLALMKAGTRPEVVFAGRYTGAELTDEALTLHYTGCAPVRVAVSAIRRVKHTRGHLIFVTGGGLGDFVVVPEGDLPAEAVLKIINERLPDDFLA